MQWLLATQIVERSALRCRLLAAEIAEAATTAAVEAARAEAAAAVTAEREQAIWDIRTHSETLLALEAAHSEQLDAERRLALDGPLARLE